MVCLHPGAVTFFHVRSMNHLLSWHHSECNLGDSRAGSRCAASQLRTCLLCFSSGCTCMAFARLGGEFCQAQHLLLIVDKWTGEACLLPTLPSTHTGNSGCFQSDWHVFILVYFVLSDSALKEIGLNFVQCSGNYCKPILPQDNFFFF